MSLTTRKVNVKVGQIVPPAPVPQIDSSDDQWEMSSRRLLRRQRSVIPDSVASPANHSAGALDQSQKHSYPSFFFLSSSFFFFSFSCSSVNPPDLERNQWTLSDASLLPPNLLPPAAIKAEFLCLATERENCLHACLCLPTGTLAYTHEGARVVRTRTSRITPTGARRASGTAAFIYSSHTRSHPPAFALFPFNPFHPACLPAWPFSWYVAKYRVSLNVSAGHFCTWATIRKNAETRHPVYIGSAGNSANTSSARYPACFSATIISLTLSLFLFRSISVVQWDRSYFRR